MNVISLAFKAKRGQRIYVRKQAWIFSGAGAAVSPGERRRMSGI